MLSPRVCAIIVTYNGLRWIEKCLNSLETSKESVDTLVIDNGSTDGTLELLRNRKITYLFKSKENLGFGKANNIGLKYGYQNGYEYFLLLNQDAWIEEATVSGLIKALEQNPDFGIVSPIHYNGSDTGLDELFQTYLNRIESYNEDKIRDQTKDIYEVSFVNAACWMIKKDTLEQVGVFHPLFEHYGEDDNYIDRLHAKNLKIGIVPLERIFHDRDSVGVNPMKNDTRRLFKRTLLQEFLKLKGPLSEEKANAIAKRLGKKLAGKLPWLKRPSFHKYCKKEFHSVFNEVKHFNKKRQAELRIK